MHAGLTQLSPGLARRLGAMPACERRSLAGRVCRVAVERTAVEAGALAEALQVLVGQAEPSPELHRRVEAVTVQLDERAWDVQDSVENGEATEADYKLAFRRARASAAVGFALTNTLESASDALYDAYFAIEEEELFTRACVGD
ncbi:hypothetical protein ABJI51_15445 [Amycolatopsis sp. NEAU-NG30]|uniref:DUF222 domain-containing protein n=1 Tax=Amycolatopsis melonis TaxID=3156488 RepID=A0ABV0LGJ9_9PSEU